MSHTPGGCATAGILRTSMHRPRAGAFPFLSYLRGTTIARHACAGAPSAMALQDDAIAPAQADQLQSADPADWPVAPDWQPLVEDFLDRKSTRLNSSHLVI